MENQINQPNPAGVQYGHPPYPTGRKEWIFALAALIMGLVVCNFIIFGGFNVGFAIAIDLCILVSTVYLLCCGHRLTPYSAQLLLISLVIGAGFARGNDGFVKFMMIGFLFISTNLGLALLAGQNRFSAGGFLSLGDSFYTGFARSMGHMGAAFSGMRHAMPRKKEGFRKFTSVLIGLAIALPVMVIMILLLTGADAAFAGLIALLPEFDMTECVVTVIFGAGAFCLIYCQGVSLQHRKKQPSEVKEHKGVNALTVNTVLIAAGFVYVAYLFSQLAYFVGGFAGILPEEYTMAQYARRGFFEMAVLCGINLTLIGLCVGLVGKKPKAPLLTRILCLFIAAVTVFFVVTASGKMFMYMNAYGLTRLRVLTQVIMLWIGLSTVLVAVWLAVPKLPYMKAIVAAGLIIGAVVLWADVDTVVARYNVDHYLSGAMDHIDTDYLGSLNRAAVPYVAKLARQAPDEQVRERARALLDEDQDRPWNWDFSLHNDWRGWNYAKHQAELYLEE